MPRLRGLEAFATACLADEKGWRRSLRRASPTKAGGVRYGVPRRVRLESFAISVTRRPGRKSFARSVTRQKLYRGRELRRVVESIGTKRTVEEFIGPTVRLVALEDTVSFPTIYLLMVVSKSKRVTT